MKIIVDNQVKWLTPYFCITAVQDILTNGVMNRDIRLSHGVIISITGTKSESDLTFTIKETK